MKTWQYITILNGLLFVVLAILVFDIFIRLSHLLSGVQTRLESLRGGVSLVARAIGLMIGLILSFIAMFFTLFWVLVGHATVAHWSIMPIFSLVLVSLPFLFTCSIVYVCFCTSHETVWRIFRWSIHPRALAFTVFAELCVAVLVFLQSKHAGYV